MSKIICERKQENFTQKTYKKIIAHDHETRYRVNNKKTFSQYSKSKCQKALVFRNKKFLNMTPNLNMPI